MEYTHSIYNHYLSLQQSTLPNISLIQQQPEINLKMRPLLLDFIMDICVKLQLSDSVFFSTVNLIDRYSSIRIIRKLHYQLLGLTCLWISCKNLEVKRKIPSLNTLIKLCCNSYNKNLFLEMENHLLKSLNWEINFPSNDVFIEFWLNKLESENVFANTSITSKDIIKTSLYISELIQYYPNLYFNYSVSQISLISLIISIKSISNINENKILNIINKLSSKEKILNFEQYQEFSNDLIKIIKCPPPSMKLKYFNNISQSSMINLVNYTNNELMKSNTTKSLPIPLPLTNLYSNNLPISPISINNSPKFINSNYILKSSTYTKTNFLNRQQQQYLPSPPNEIPLLRKRSSSISIDSNKRLKN